MHDPIDHHPLYTPTVNEQSRQDFVVSLKLLANGAVQQRVRDAYEARVAPAYCQERGLAPVRRKDVQEQLLRQPEARQWGVFTHHSQTMMWSAVEATAARVADQAAARFRHLYSTERKLGSLQLDESLAVPTPIANTEIHRQPKGFLGADPGKAMLAGLRYFGSGRIYAPGKGNAAAGANARGAFLLEQIQSLCPNLRPKRILDLGCGLAVASQAVAAAYSAAEYHALDVAGGLLKMAHLLAEEARLPIHFYQRDAAATQFPDGHFDLIISHIMFHETNSARLPQILRECRRLLAKGAAMVHVDVATQISRMSLADQVMNDWQVRWNGEPFWTMFAELDMRRELLDAGFEAEQIFAEYRAKPGAGVSFVFGARS